MRLKLGITGAAFGSLLAVTSATAGTLSTAIKALRIGDQPYIQATLSGTPISPHHSRNYQLPRVTTTGLVQVYIHPPTRWGQVPPASELRSIGAKRIVSSPSLGVAQAWVPISRLGQLANLPDVGGVSLPVYALAPQPIHPASTTQSVTTNSTVSAGLAIDQTAIDAMQANQLQKVGAAGKGIKVGVISDDNSGYSASEQAGYLPAGIWSDPTYPGTSPTAGDPAEGTAMLEIVHAMAPSAQLGFCAPTTSVDFLTCYNDFTSWGARVIVDDLGFPETDYFSIGNTDDSSFAYAVSSFAQSHLNVALLSSAGNDGYDYFQAPYTAGPGATIDGTTYASLMDFGKAAGQSSNTKLQVTLNPNYQFQPVLEWNDPLNTVSDKLTLYLLSGSGSVLAKGTTYQTGNGQVLETFNYTSGSSVETDYLEVACQSCANPITIKLDGWGDGAVVFNLDTYGSEAAGQKVASGVIATAAAWRISQNPLSINREAYSSTGPFLYGDYNVTSQIERPNLTGIDNVLVSGAGGFGVALSSGGALFCGTSAAAPNVASLIAALMQADPSQPASFFSSELESTANQSSFSSDSTARGQCSVGSKGAYSQDFAGQGLAQGYAALNTFYTFPSTNMTKPVKVASGQTASYTAPVGANITYSATGLSGSNSVNSSNCTWTQNGTSPKTGASVVYAAATVGTFAIVANCPDSHGIKSPTPPTLLVNAKNVTAPSVSISGVSTKGFSLTLGGIEPLTLSSSSSNSSVLPNSGIVISPSSCGTTTLTCTVSLAPSSNANGTTVVTIKASDQWGRTASAQQSIGYGSAATGSGGGGSLGLLSLASLFLLSAISLLARGPFRNRHRTFIRDVKISMDSHNKSIDLPPDIRPISASIRENHFPHSRSKKSKPCEH